MTYWNSCKRSQNNTTGQKKNVKNTNKLGNRLAQRHDLLKMFLWNSNDKRSDLPTGKAANEEADAFAFTHHSFFLSFLPSLLHSFIHSFRQQLLSAYFTIILMDFAIVD